MSEDTTDIPVEAGTGGPPKNIRSTRRIGDRLYIAGQGPKPARIMFLATAVLEEEAAETQASHYGKAIRQKPRYLKGAPGVIFADLVRMCGIDMKECYYTAMVKWLLPKARRDNPKKEDLDWCEESLVNEIAEVKPDIIVTLGKPPFKFLTGLSVKVSDVKGGWLHSARFNCRVFPMEKITLLVSKPEYTEKFRVELLEVQKMLQLLKGISQVEVVRHYTTTENLGQAVQLVQMWKDQKLNLQSVDCEWGGNNHVDGSLRSIQFCWAPGYATYVKFMDQSGQYCFDAPYAQVGALLGQHLNDPSVKYIGHHISADFPWMHKYLGLEWYNKCVMDTEFGQQCVDEYEDLGLERLAIKYTDLGRYDLDLFLYNKAHKPGHSDGYAYVPDEIIIPYGCADVDVPFRAFPIIHMGLFKQPGLLKYFYEIFLPFVTNVFTQFAITGLPVNIPKMDELREVFHYAKEGMSARLQKKIAAEADLLMMQAFLLANTKRGAEAFTKIREALKQGMPDVAFQNLKEIFGLSYLQELQVLLEHRKIADQFNIRSPIHMRRWLFQVKKLTPIKSTNRKEQGIPAMSWEKVMELPPEKQKEFNPAVDKQTLEILGQKDELIGELIDLNMVGNICKAFLKEAQVDEETGEVSKENGLHFWLASDGRIHGQMSTTETGRPRSWKPNSLNLPKYVNARITRGIKSLLAEQDAEGTLREDFRHYLDGRIPSIRSCVDARSMPPVPGSAGWCLVESDYQTAEVRALAFISGDQGMISLITQPDPNFAYLKDGALVRVGFEGVDLNAEKFSHLLFGVYEKGELVRRASADDLLKVDGKLSHPKADLHWALAEDTHHTPREMLDKNRHRDPAKIVRFSGTYGATGETLDRKIEADTGIKPEPGTGGKTLAALQAKQVVATQHQKMLEGYPVDPGYYRSVSGRYRHFYLHPENAYPISSRQRKNSLSALSREALNFPYQEIVAASAARASNRLLELYRESNMHAVPMQVLYDAIVTLCPLEERFQVKSLHQKCMADENEWEHHGRKWNFPIDTAFCYAWSEDPTAEEMQRLDDEEWAVVYCRP